MDLFGTKKPAPTTPAAARTAPKPRPQTPLGMLKSKVDAGSTAGTLRDNWSKIDQQIKDAGG